ncbi:TBC1 domain family member 2B-like isoform X1 [Ornithodoros turicata]|uniref:TBC1 domain family member 2B-like isoform X1 n=1 Tax=Ornithodoros turicata TaxID=34597 RepID=UPI0031386EE4
MASDKGDCEPRTEFVFPPEESSSVSPAPSANVQLCGYLNKMSSRSLVKTYKRRWFVFSEGNCKLYYYNEAGDSQPVGEIDVKAASFYIGATSWERPGAFIIRTQKRDYHLEAKDRQASLYWLQELQRHRRAYNLKRTQVLQKSSCVFDAVSPTKIASGLLCKQSVQDQAEGKPPDSSLLLSPVECPKSVVGEHTADPPSPSVLSNLKNPAALFHKKLRLQGSSEDKTASPEATESTGLSHFYSDGNCEREILEEGDVSLHVGSPKLKSPTALSSFRKRLQDSFRLKAKGDLEMFSAQPLLRKLHPEGSCGKCKEFEATVSTLKDDIQCLEDELAASKEVITVLRQQLDMGNAERETLVRLYADPTNENYTKMLHEKDKLLFELRNELYSCKLQLESTQDMRRSIEQQLNDVKEQGSLYEEVLREKDRLLMTLTNELNDIETEKKEDHANKEHENPESLVERLKEEVDTLKDAVTAFHVQNKFLNKEILELNELRWNSDERERQLIIKCSNAEARCLQTQSKLLFLLKELSTPQEGQEHAQEVVRQLLDEAMHDPSLQKDVNEVLLSSDEMYDMYGFNRKWGKEEDIISSRAEHLKRRSENYSVKMQDAAVMSWRAKWENFLANSNVSKNFQKSPEFKALIRTGIPPEFRSQIWKGCIAYHVGREREQRGSGYYEMLLDTPTTTGALDPAEKQIELDLLRTLPNNRHYETPDAPGINPLRRVLLAFSRRNLVVGYCQGLNRLAAIALLFMSEEDAFWCLVAIVEHIMPHDYYSRTLEASQADQRVLKDMMVEKLPKLHSHLDSNKVDLSLFTFNWFLTVFVDTIPAETYLYIWDVFLYEGNKVLFRFALAIFKMCELEILAQEDYMTISRYLRIMPEKVTDIKRLAHIAFNELNPFSMRSISAKRTIHTNAVKEQLRRLDEIRNSLPAHDSLAWESTDSSPPSPRK